MKNLCFVILTFILSVHSLVANSQALPNNHKCYDSLTISGFYVIVYTKKEVKDNARNLNMLQSGKSFKIVIDRDYQEFFISSSLEQKGLNFPKILNSILEKNKTGVYTSFESLARFNFIDAMPDCYYSLAPVSNWPLLSSSNYYTTKARKNKYCYQIFPIDAEWFHLHSEKEFAINILRRQSGFLDRQKSFFDIYIFKETKALSSVFHPEKYGLRFFKF